MLGKCFNSCSKTARVTVRPIPQCAGLFHTLVTKHNVAWARKANLKIRTLRCDIPQKIFKLREIYFIQFTVTLRITVTMISFSKSSSIGARCLGCSLLSKITLATVASITVMPISPTCLIARSYTGPVVTAPSFRSCHWVGLCYGVCTEIKGKFTQLKLLYWY